MNKIGFFLTALLAAFNLLGQDFISTARPYNTFGGAVGKSNFQTEAGINVLNKGADLSFFHRYGIIDRLEVNMINRIRFNPNELAPVHLGIRGKLLNQHQSVPAILVEVGANIPKTGLTNESENERAELSAVGIFIWEAQNNFSLVTNLGATSLEQDAKGLRASFAIGKGITQRFGLMAEYFGTYYRNSHDDLVNLGAYAKLTKKIQLDASISHNINKEFSFRYVSAGISYKWSD